MRAHEEQEIVLPTLRLAFATARCLHDIRVAASARLPAGWSVTDIDPPEGGSGFLVHPDEADAGEYLVSECGGLLELHALREETMIRLGRRQAGGMAVLPSARAA